MDDDAPATRIGHLERDEALEDLDVHRQAGRLDGQEYEDRTLQVGRSRTWDDLDAVFRDLPEPRPVRPLPSHSDGPVHARATAPVPAQPGEPPADGSGWGAYSGRYQRLVPIVFGLTPFLALALFYTTTHWEWFLLVPVAGVIARGLAGDHTGHQRKKGHYPHGH